MADLINNIQNKALEGLSALAPRNVVSAIKDAASETGVDFAYLLQQAKAESSFDADAQAKTSSASGLFQFIEKTWMGMVDQHGDKYGIDKDASKAEILELRNDPEIASKMAAEFAGENKAYLEKTFDGDIGSTELYFAHFMGAGGGSSFLNAHKDDPAAPAAVLFPKAAAANENVFYDRETGRAKSLDEVYAFFDKKFTIEGGDTSTSAVTQLAEATVSNTPAPSIAQVSFAMNELFSSPQNQTDPSQNSMASLFGSMTDRDPSAADTGSLIPSSYQSLFASPMDLILLTQLDMPGIETPSLSGEKRKGA